MEFDYSGILIDADPATGTYCATYHYPAQPPSTTVALALMQIIDSEVTDLDPLHEAAGVTADALDDLFDHTGSEPYLDGCVTFTYLEYTVMVKSHGRIVIQSPTVSTDHSH